MAKRIKTLRCPSCRTIVQAKDEFFPFCCDHCRSIDLGKWASGVYKISSPVLDPEVLEGLSNDASTDSNSRSSDDDDQHRSSRNRS